jgi:hypothetical protein
MLSSAEHGQVVTRSPHPNWRKAGSVRASSVETQRAAGSMDSFGRATGSWHLFDLIRSCYVTDHQLCFLSILACNFLLNNLSVLFSQDRTADSDRVRVGTPPALHGRELQEGAITIVTPAGLICPSDELTFQIRVSEPVSILECTVSGMRCFDSVKKVSPAMCGLSTSSTHETDRMINVLSL